MTGRLAPAGLTMLGVVVVFAVATGCSSSSKPAAVATGGASTSVLSTSPTQPSTPTTVASQLPTVPNCGGGAYEPKTLLIVCGSGTTMATGVSWRSWEKSTASGSGTVHLTVNGHPATAPATLLLSEVVNGPTGPQFSRLTVTWAGASPDGRRQDAYRLQL